MEFERDEMFRLMSVRMSQWKAKSRMTTIAAAGQSAGSSNKKQKDAGVAKKPEPPKLDIKPTAPGKKKDLSYPIQKDYDAK